MANTDRERAIDTLQRLYDYARIEDEIATRQSEQARDVKDCRDMPKMHPTEKPQALMRWCLSLVPEAKTVLDPFMGSGTTLVAARLEGRKAIGIEISEKYCESAVKRLAQKTLF